MTTNTTPTNLDQSFAYVRQVTREQAGNFYHGLKLLPEPKRSALYAVYAWNRLADDLADDANPTSSDEIVAVRDQLEQFRACTLAAYTGDASTMTQLATNFPHPQLWPAFADVCRTYPIRQSDLLAMIEGQLMDLELTRYDTFDQLYRYCYNVASSVGFVCISVWGYDNHPKVWKYAEARGIALQLTNILRDVREDAARQRIYLPQDLAQQHHVDLGVMSRSSIASPEAVKFLQALADRAEAYYQISKPLEHHLSSDTQATSWAMTAIYHRLLKKIQSDPARVLRERVRLSKWEKMMVGVTACLR